MHVKDIKEISGLDPLILSSILVKKKKIVTLVTGAEAMSQQLGGSPPQDVVVN